jgi:hypothetical protein
MNCLIFRITALLAVCASLCASPVAEIREEIRNEGTWTYSFLAAISELRKSDEIVNDPTTVFPLWSKTDQSVDAVFDNVVPEYSEEELRLMISTGEAFIRSDVQEYVSLVWDNSSEKGEYTSTDLTLYNAAKETISSLSPYDGQWIVTDLDNWQPLVLAEKPTLRHLALLGVQHTIPSQLAAYSELRARDNDDAFFLSAYSKYAFYEQYFKESNPAILKDLFTAMSQVPIPQSRDFLASNLEDLILTEGNDRLIHHLRLRIEQLDMLIQKGPTSLPESWTSISKAIADGEIENIVEIEKSSILTKPEMLSGKDAASPHSGVNVEKKFLRWILIFIVATILSFGGFRMYKNRK